MNAHNSGFFLVVATEKYYNCDVYTNEENTTSNHTLCVEDFQDGKFYCKSWECDTPDCPTDQQTTQSDCPICPGMYDLPWTDYQRREIRKSFPYVNVYRILNCWLHMHLEMNKSTTCSWKVIITVKSIFFFTIVILI